MRRTLFVFLLTFTLSLIGLWGAYLTVEGSQGFIGPAVMSSSKGGITYAAIHSPGWMIMNASFNGKGTVVVLDQFSNETLFASNVSGHLNVPIVFPGEGSYAIYVSDGSLTLSGHHGGVYPTTKVQKALYGSMAVLSFVLALWGWRK